MKLRLYNSLNGKKEDFHPIDPDHVRVYACGPTVYSYAHIGNARMAVVFDLLVRVLRTQYKKVTYVSNITDVDDKIMAASKESGEAIETITTRYTRIYNEDMAALGVLPPDVQPTATSHIAEMIALNEKLIARNHAYEAKGHVLFNVPSYPAYGALSGRSRDDQFAGARVEVLPFKKDPADFVLWKPSEPDQVGWDSPWGRGRPGWHIECSAMAEKHLGLPFDIHGGGADLKFPHHENEIAQSCCAHGHENEPDSFSRYWVHNGFVTVEGEKMSKSLGNTLLAHDLIKDQPGEVLRLALLSAHYRQPLDWSRKSVQQAQKYLDKLYRTLQELKNIPTSEVSVPENVMAALYDDLNVPMALAEINKMIASKPAPEILKGQLLAIGNLLGILQQNTNKGFSHHDEASPVKYSQERYIKSLIVKRQKAKAERNFNEADRIRRKLEAERILIVDGLNGAEWKNVGVDVFYKDSINALNQFFEKNLGRLHDGYKWQSPFSNKLNGKEDYSSNLDYKKSLNLKWINASLDDKQEMATELIKCWGGISANKPSTIEGYIKLSMQDCPAMPFKGVSTYSKILSIANPERYAIYDSRVAACLNAIQYNAKVKIGATFCYPTGRNPKINIFIRDRKFTKQALIQRGWREIFPRKTYETYLEILRECQKSFPQKNLYDLEMTLFAFAEEECAKAIGDQ